MDCFRVIGGFFFGDPPATTDPEVAPAFAGGVSEPAAATESVIPPCSGSLRGSMPRQARDTSAARQSSCCTDAEATDVYGENMRQERSSPLRRRGRQSSGKDDSSEQQWNGPIIYPAQTTAHPPKARDGGRLHGRSRPVGCKGWRRTQRGCLVAGARQLQTKAAETKTVKSTHRNAFHRETSEVAPNPRLLTEVQAPNQAGGEVSPSVGTCKSI